jgi:hypothetical protein
MNKVLPILIVVALLLVGGYFYLNSQKTTKPQGEKMMQKEEKKDVFTSIKDAMTKKLSLKCDYSDEKGNKVTTFIKGEQMRSDIQTDKGDSHTLFMENKIYIWEDKTKQGTVMTIEKKEMEKMQQEGEKMMQESKDKETMVEDLEKYKQSCRADTVPASTFEVPKDVKFTDLSVMMEQFQLSPQP